MWFVLVERCLKLTLPDLNDCGNKIMGTDPTTTSHRFWGRFYSNLEDTVVGCWLLSLMLWLGLLYFMTYIYISNYVFIYIYIMYMSKMMEAFDQCQQKHRGFLVIHSYAEYGRLLLQQDLADSEVRSSEAPQRPVDHHRTMISYDCRMFLLSGVIQAAH